MTNINSLPNTLVGSHADMWVHGGVLLNHMIVIGRVTPEGGLVLTETCRVDRRQIRKQIRRLITAGVEVSMPDSVKAVLAAHKR